MGLSVTEDFDFSVGRRLLRVWRRSSEFVVFLEDYCGCYVESEFVGRASRIVGLEICSNELRRLGLRGSESGRIRFLFWYFYKYVVFV